MANGLRGAIPWEEAGEGRALLLSNEDLGVLQTKFGDDWFEKAAERCDTMHVPFIMAVLELGGRLGTQSMKVPIKLSDLEHIPFIDIASKALDTIFKSVQGVTFMEYVDKQLKRQASAAGNPPMSLGSSLIILEETLSRQDLNPTSSGPSPSTRPKFTSKKDRRRK